MSVALLEALERAAAGLLLAFIVARAARRAGVLSSGGSVAATLLGAIAMAAGWPWGALLVAWFVTTSVLSRYRRRLREERTSGVVAKGGARDAWQVAANGGVFGAMALASLLDPSGPWMLAGAGALAAAASDTWGTELGTLAPTPPRSILTWRPVPPGSSGAVSLRGTLASIAGAMTIAVLAGLLRFPWALGAITASGLAGSVADSLLGATVQARRWCDRCGEGTERAVHRCGEVTRPAGGVAWVTNDAVNLACTLVGAATGMVLWGLGEGR